MIASEVEVGILFAVVGILDHPENCVMDILLSRNCFFCVFFRIAGAEETQFPKRFECARKGSGSIIVIISQPPAQLGVVEEEVVICMTAFLPGFYGADFGNIGNPELGLLGI